MCCIFFLLYIILMCFLVSLHIRRFIRLVWTPWVVTCIRCLSSVSSHVSLQVESQSKWFIAFITFEWPLSLNTDISNFNLLYVSWYAVSISSDPWKKSCSHKNYTYFSTLTFILVPYPLNSMNSIDLRSIDEF